MENASRAIIIAGGILVGIITVSILILMFNNIQIFVDNTSNNNTDELIAYNKQFEIYNKKLMYGIEVLNAVNKAVDNNKRYNITNDKNNEYYVDIIIKNVFTLSNANDIDNAIETMYLSDFKRKTFKCSNVTYNSFGRVCKLQFEEYI